MEGGEGPPPPPPPPPATTTTTGNDWGDEEKRVDDAELVGESEKTGGALCEEETRETRQIESAIADASGTDGEDENEKDDDDKDDALRCEIEKENEEGKEKFLRKAETNYKRRRRRTNVRGKSVRRRCKLQ